MQSRARFARITFQLVSRFSLCNCGANHDGDCLGTCRAFMVTTLNCCRGELALSCSRCVGWHKRNLSSLATASWHQETGLWDTEEECGMERGWERYSEERGHDYRSAVASDGGGFIKADTGERRREDETTRSRCISITGWAWFKNVRVKFWVTKALGFDTSLLWIEVHSDEMPACTCVDHMHLIQRQEADCHEVNRDCAARQVLGQGCG